MAHVSTPEAVQGIRSAATVNRLALISVAAQIEDQLAHVALFPNTPAKGQLRDGLTKLRQRYTDAATLNGRMVALSTVVLDMLGAPPPPPADDPPPPATLWSTGNW